MTMKIKNLVSVAGAAAMMMTASVGYAQCYASPGTARDVLLERLNSGQFEFTSAAASEDQYLIGDWDGDGLDNVGVRRGNQYLLDTDFTGGHDISVRYGGKNEDDYLVGDFTQSGCDTIAIRRDNSILIDTDLDGRHDITLVFGAGNAADEYYVADFDGDGNDDIGVRTGNQTVRDLGPAWDGVEDGTLAYGGGSNEDQYLWGSWCPPCIDDGIPVGPLRQQVAVRRGNQILMNDDHDAAHEFLQVYGSGSGEDEYLIGDMDGDGLDNVIVRRGNILLIDANYDGSHDSLQVFGTGTP